MASVKQVQVTFDCAEPKRVARFWCEVLGYVLPPPPQGFATWDDFERTLPPERQGMASACVDPSGAGPRLFFQRVPEGKRDEPRTGHQRLASVVLDHDAAAEAWLAVTPSHSA